MEEMRTIYMTFRGYCMHCGRAVGDAIHGNDDCNMDGAEQRLAYIGMAWDDWLAAERAARVVKAARDYLEYADDETRGALRDELAFWDRRNREIAQERASGARVEATS